MKLYLTVTDEEGNEYSVCYVSELLMEATASKGIDW